MATCAAEGCDREFYVYPGRIGTRRFCSRACACRSRPPQSEAAKEAKRQKMLGRTGEKNPNYRHGRRVGKHSREVARLFNLKKKGETRCRNCGSREHVQPHHAIPRSIGTKESKLDLRNCLPLCSRCHARWHRRTLTIYRDVFTSEEWAYLVSVKLTGRETEAWLDAHYPSRLAA